MLKNYDLCENKNQFSSNGDRVRATIETWKIEINFDILPIFRIYRRFDRLMKMNSGYKQSKAKQR